MDAVHRYRLTATPDMADGSRHVNNVVYLKWVQDAAIEHAAISGCTRLGEQIGASWVVRTHRIEYRVSAYPGDEIIVETWVADIRKVRSLRRYKIIRARDGVLLADGETDWVFVDAQTGKPRSIPPEIAQSFVLLPDPAAS